jgi:hypothetical protein
MPQSHGLGLFYPMQAALYSTASGPVKICIAACVPVFTLLCNYLAVLCHRCISTVLDIYISKDLLGLLRIGVPLSCCL